MSAHSGSVVVWLGLLLSMSPPLQGEEPRPQTPKEQYEALVKEYQEADATWRKSGKKPVDPAWVEWYAAWPMWSFAPRFLQFAEANPKDPTAVEALLQLVGFMKSGRHHDQSLFPNVTRALMLLSQNHLDDERVIRACLPTASSTGPGPEAYLRALLAKGRDRDVRARACWALIYFHQARRSVAQRPWFDEPESNPAYQKSTVFLHARCDPEYVKYVRTTDPVAVLEETTKLLERMIEEFGDVPFPPGWSRSPETRTFGELSKLKLDALRSIAVGQVAPEIQGEDIEGKPLRLSDYRGKVVVLSFWGTWCGPCMKMIPHEKALVERLKDRPFVLLGINSDTERDTLKAAMEKEGITWRSWWDGGRTGGPIASRWDVHIWPTFIVLDQKGVIRYSRRLPTGGLDEAVDTLLNTAAP